jgi:hypothetical protein
MTANKLTDSLRKIGVWILFIGVGSLFVYVSYLALGLTFGWVHFGDAILLGSLLSGLAGYELLCGLLAFAFMAFAFWSTVRGQK